MRFSEYSESPRSIKTRLLTGLAWINSASTLPNPLFKTKQRVNLVFMKLNVPDPVAAYLAAEEAKDAEKLALCFTEDGTVRDEEEDHHGREAIRQWKQEADAKYRFVLVPLHARTEADEVIVRARITGDFPGGTVELDHIFQLSGDKIAALEIRP